MPEPELTVEKLLDFLEDVLFTLIVDEHLHPDHDPDCGCVYGHIKKVLGPERTVRIVADAKRCMSE